MSDVRLSVGILEGKYKAIMLFSSYTIHFQFKELGPALKPPYYPFTIVVVSKLDPEGLLTSTISPCMQLYGVKVWYYSSLFCRSVHRATCYLLSPILPLIMVVFFPVYSTATTYRPLINIITQLWFWAHGLSSFGFRRITHQVLHCRFPPISCSPLYLQSILAPLAVERRAEWGTK